jgi:AraC-like DNA-binding protein
MNNLQFSPVTSPEVVLSNYEVCRSNDLDEVRSSAAKILCENELKLGGCNKELDASFFYRKVGSIGVGRISYGAEITITPVVFEDFLLIQMPIRGMERITLGNDKVVSTPKVFGIINPGVKSVINHEADTEKLIIRVDKKLIEKNCQQILNLTLNKDIEFDSTMLSETKAGSQWMSMVGWIFNFISDEDKLSPMMVSQFENMLVNMLLTNQCNNYSPEIHNDSVSIAPFFVKRVEHYIQDNAHKPIAINDMAEYAGVSSRALFTGFRKYRNTTPMRHLKEVRLQYVHEDLKRACVGTDKVITVAFNWGFSHLGHFSTDYKRRFGETPYETLLR